MLKRTIAIAAACALMGILSGCSGTGNLREETLLDKNWGRSVESAKYNQIIDPAAGKAPKPVEGLDGTAAGYAVDRYENSFKKETQQQSTATTTVIK